MVDKLNYMYLRMYFNSARTIKVDISLSVRKFFASDNAILSHTKFISEMTRLRLFETFFCHC